MKLMFSRSTYDTDVEDSFPKKMTAEQRLMEDLKKTRTELEIAYSGFDNVTDPDLIDCYIYEVNSLLKRYTYLTNLAKEERVPVKELSSKSPVYTLVSQVLG